MKTIFSLIYLLFCTCTAIVGSNIHHSIFWSIVNFFFAPLSIIKWLIFKEINMHIIQHSFDFFFN